MLPTAGLRSGCDASWTAPGFDSPRPKPFAQVAYAWRIAVQTGQPKDGPPLDIARHLPCRRHSPTWAVLVRSIPSPFLMTWLVYTVWRSPSTCHRRQRQLISPGPQRPCSPERRSPPHCPPQRDWSAEAGRQHSRQARQLRQTCSTRSAYDTARRSYPGCTTTSSESRSAVNPVRIDCCPRSLGSRIPSQDAGPIALQAVSCSG